MINSDLLCISNEIHLWFLPPRYISVCHPMMAKAFCTTFRAKVISTLVFVTMAAAAVPYGLRYHTGWKLICASATVHATLRAWHIVCVYVCLSVCVCVCVCGCGGNIRAWREGPWFLSSCLGKNYKETSKSNIYTSFLISFELSCNLNNLNKQIP